jgi:hypothetical protein
VILGAVEVEDNPELLIGMVLVDLILVDSGLPVDLELLVVLVLVNLTLLVDPG